MGQTRLVVKLPSGGIRRYTRWDKFLQWMQASSLSPEAEIRVGWDGRGTVTTPVERELLASYKDAIGVSPSLNYREPWIVLRMGEVRELCIRSHLTQEGVGVRTPEGTPRKETFGTWQGTRAAPRWESEISEEYQEVVKRVRLERLQRQWDSEDLDEDEMEYAREKDRLIDAYEEWRRSFNDRPTAQGFNAAVKLI